MQFNHTPATLSAAFDDANLVSSAGLVPVMRLAERAGLTHLADTHLTVPTDKGANWQAAVEAAGFSDLMRLVRDYMAVGDYIVPFGYSSTAYRKVR